jgi:hypothetical protein
MSGKRDIRGYVNPFVPGTSAATQLASMPPDAEVYTEDKTGKKIEALIRSVRKGSLVAVYELYCLAPGIGRAPKRRNILADRMEVIHDAGGCIEETSGTERAKARRLLHAYEQIATSGRARKRDKEGRPANPWTTHELDVMETIWFSRRYKNDDERLTAIEKRINKRPGRTWIRNKFGSPHKTGEDS